MIENSLIRLIDLQQGSENWYEFRRMKIGSSMAANIMGVGFKTPLQQFDEIMDGARMTPTQAMERGTRLEPEAREWLNCKYGSYLQPAVVQHPVHDWHFSSLDGLDLETQGKAFVCEIKCAGRVDHDLALQGIVPPKYVPQCLHILEDLPNVERLLYFSYQEESQAEVWVYRDEVAMAAQLSEELAFFDRLLNYRPPEPVDRDWIEIRDSRLESKANTYALLMNQIDELKAEAESLKGEVIEGAGAHPRIKLGQYRLQKIRRPGAIDYSKIEALKEIDTSAYRKEPIVFWKMT